MLFLAKNKLRFRFLELETFRLSHCKVLVYLELIKENTAHAMRCLAPHIAQRRRLRMRTGYVRGKVSPGNFGHRVFPVS